MSLNFRWKSWKNWKAFLSKLKIWNLVKIVFRLIFNKPLSLTKSKKQIVLTFRIMLIVSCLIHLEKSQSLLAAVAVMKSLKIQVWRRYKQNQIKRRTHFCLIFLWELDRAINQLSKWALFWSRMYLLERAQTRF
jgi:hypothetical protein